MLGVEPHDNRTGSAFEEEADTARAFGD